MRVQASSAQSDMMLAGIYRSAASAHRQHARARARKRRHDAAKNR
ncbi:hypothetical protein ABEV00_27320 [Paenibacillus thiaminolyticus]